MRVRPGVAYRCGPHLLACADLLTDAFHGLMGGEPYEWVYTDPPWGEAQAKRFRTVNGQKGVEPHYATLLDRVCDLATAATKGAFIEIGLRWTEEISTRMSARGTAEHERYAVSYGTVTRPNAVQYYPRGSTTCPPRLDGLKGLDVVKVAMSIMQPGETVLDPCIGLGNTLKAGHQHGLRVLGLELNPQRLQRCLDWAAKKGMEPVPAKEVRT